MKLTKVLLLLYFFSSCGNSKSAQRIDSVYRESGIIFFTERKISRTLTLNSSDITYTLNGPPGDYDFFVPVKWGKDQRLCKEEIKKILLSKKEFSANTFIIPSDCNFLQRESYIREDCEYFENDSILNSHGRTIYFMPVELDYVIKKGYDNDYLTNNGRFTLKIDSTTILITITKNNYRIIQEAVLRDRDECKK